MRPRHLALLTASVMLGACAVSPPASPDFPDREWAAERHNDPFYLIGPGDTLELTVYTAPELSREIVTVAPDGRVRLPLIPPIMAAARTPEDLEAHVRAAYRDQLREPNLDLLLTGTTSQQVFVGGAVQTPGLFPLPGQIDALQAIILAGGITNEGNRGEAFLMRRVPGGELKTAIIDLDAGWDNPALADWGPLQRYDVVWVPRTAIANQNQFIEQYVRRALPVDFSLFYDVAGNGR